MALMCFIGDSILDYYCKLYRLVAGYKNVLRF